MVDKMFRQTLKRLFHNAIRADFNTELALYETENIFRRSIKDIYFDTQKLAELSSNVFDKEIYPMLKIGKIEHNGRSIDLSYLKKVIPEVDGILREINLYLKPGEKIQEIGKICAENEELSKFKITLFVNTICYIMLDKEFTKLDGLSEIEFKKFKLGFIRTLIHEFNHLRNYFTKSKEWLLNDFKQFYSFSEFEQEAFVIEFFYHFLQEDGVDLINNNNKSNFLKKVKMMRCWKTGLELDYIGPNVEKIDEFLQKLYEFFKDYKDEFRETKICNDNGEFITTVEDIRNIYVPEYLLTRPE